MIHPRNHRLMCAVVIHHQIVGQYHHTIAFNNQAIQIDGSPLPY